MKKILLSIISSIILSIFCLGQTVIEAAHESLDSLNKIYTIFDKEAKFPGDSEAWRKFIQKNLKINLPLKNGAPDGTYQVFVRFIVGIDGKISDFYAETSFGYGMEDEVIRMIKKCPNWEPALRYGRKVNSIKRQRISFVYATK
ncbi:MAG: hypothetical protein ABIN01_15225 [Ferruginibacter sp.]